jgi:acetate kinase
MRLAEIGDMAPRRLVTINVGSSSLRLTLFAGTARRELHLDPRTPEPALLDAIEEPPDVVVHRLVHGGATLRAPTLIDDASLRTLREAVPLAPLHLPGALDWIAAARARWPAARALALFDTAFYATLPPEAATYALPPEVRALGVQRYGFHGLAHQSMLRHVDHSPRVITFQLGSGASVTASRDGRAVDTSMGFSPLCGLVMATRPGDVDPGVLMFLLRRGFDAAAIEAILEKQSGLLGLAGASDMRLVLGRDDEAARLAVAVYVAQARKYLGAYLAVLGGCDAIAFGGGVGEHAPAIRAAILAGFAWAGIAVDTAANDNARGRLARIDAPTSRSAVWVTPVDEAAVMRDEALTFLDKEPR